MLWLCEKRKLYSINSLNVNKKRAKLNQKIDCVWLIFFHRSLLCSLICYLLSLPHSLCSYFSINFVIFRKIRVWFWLKIEKWDKTIATLLCYFVSFFFVFLFFVDVRAHRNLDIKIIYDLRCDFFLSLSYIIIWSCCCFDCRARLAEIDFLSSIVFFFVCACFVFCLLFYSD